MIDGCSHLVVPEANKPEGRLWLGLDPKTLPCKVFAGPVNTPFADSFAPQPSNPQPSTLDTSSRFLPSSLLGFPFFSPCTVVAPNFPCVFFIFSFAADRAGLQHHDLHGLRAVVLPLFRPHLFGAV